MNDSFITAWAEGVEAYRGNGPSISPYESESMLNIMWQMGYRNEPLSFGASF